jgi:hypothetical protein
VFEPDRTVGILDHVSPWFLDYLQLRGLADACNEAGRWEFLFVGAPLRISGGTGSPLNPIAIF